MFKKLIVSAGILFLTVFAYAYDDNDLQIWNTDSEEFAISDNSKITMEEEFRWGDNAKEFYYHHYDAGLVYSLRKYLNISAGYRHIYELKRDKFKLERAPYAVAAFSWDIKGFKFEDRNRFEYRHFDYQADSGRYRNKITIKLPWKLTRLAIQPFVSDEVFLGFGGVNQFNQNRFSTGLGFNINKGVRAEIYYMLQSSKSAGLWKGANVLGTKLKIAF